MTSARAVLVRIGAAAVAISSMAAPLAAPAAAVPARPIVLVADHRVVPAATRRAAALTLRRQLGRLEQSYDFTYPRSVRLVFAETPRQFVALAGGVIPSDAVAFAQSDEGVIVVSPASWRDQPERLGAVLAAEASHLVVEAKFAAVGKDVPRWLDEGLSSYAGGDFGLQTIWLEQQPGLLKKARTGWVVGWDLLLQPWTQEIIVARARLHGPIPPVQRTDAWFEDGTARVHLAYATTYLFVDYLASRHGADALRRFVSAAASPGVSVDRAAVGVFGLNIGATQNAWRASMRSSLVASVMSVGLGGVLIVLLVWATLVVAVAVALRGHRAETGQARWRRGRGPDDRDLDVPRVYHIHPRGAKAASASQLTLIMVLAVCAAARPAILPGAALARSPSAASTPFVTVMADDGVVPASVQRASAAGLRKDLATLASFYSFSDTKAVRLVLASTPADFERLAGPVSGDVLAVADESKRLIIVSPASWRGDPVRADGVMMHEASHIVLGAKFAAAGAPLPRWLNEGVAQYVANDWEFDIDWAAHRGQIMQEAATSGTLEPLRNLDALFHGNRSEVELVYAESYSFVAFLASTRGRPALRGFIDAAARPGATTDGAALAVFGSGLSPLERDWRGSLAQSAGWWEVLLSGSNFITLLWTALALLVVVGFVLVTYRKRRAYAAIEHESGYDDDGRQAPVAEDDGSDGAEREEWR